ncbi:MAG: alpha/beta fold hydrolase [Propionibacteriaceae bacterium]|jgi:multidrug/hemolysin transport system ATP-binding protein|nr:alpha/beta fold hydrolase [Propionibacteriaceae bacterium]
MPRIEVAGRQVYVQDLNPKADECVIMVHGMMTNHTVFHRCGAFRLRRRFRVVLYDLRGHGLTGSDGRPPDLSLATLAGDLFDLMDALGLARAHLVGYSFGAAVVLRAALAQPDRVDRIALVEPFGLNAQTVDDLPGVEAVRADADRALRAYGVATGRDDRRIELAVKQFLALTQEDALGRALRQDADFFATAALPELSHPVLLLNGHSSPYLADADLAHRRLPHSESQRTRGDHNLPVTKATWVQDLLWQWFGRVDRRSGDQPEPVADRPPAGPVRLARRAIDADARENRAPASPVPAIRVRGLRKDYGRVRAVKGIDFEVPQGCFFAFLGVNGAGKSTTIKCLITLLRPDAGEVEVAGQRLGRADQAIRDAIGVVFQNSLLDRSLTVRENLELRGRLQGVAESRRRERIVELDQMLGLGQTMDRRYGRLSGGQQRRVDIARALLHDPVVLFLDEPTAGLDPQSREQVWRAVEEVRRSQGMTVFLTTHYMEETERADLVSVIDSGQIVARGTPGQLRSQHSKSELTLRLSGPTQTAAFLAALPNEVELVSAADSLRLRLSTTAQAKWLLERWWPDLVDFEFRHGSMDDVFLSLTETGAGSDRVVA